MVFNSLHFLIFFPLVTALYFALPRRQRWAMLLVASCYFYMAFIPAYILILFFTITVDYFIGLKLESMREPRGRKAFLSLSLAGNVGVLAVFKYYFFIGENVERAAAFLGWNYSLPALSILLPIGLSFHTFQSMSYIVEVYRGNQKAERNFGLFALYVMYYPQLVAGPIERPQNLLHQFREEHSLDFGRIAEGLRRMLWGLFKKVAVADQLSGAVDAVYGDPAGHGALALCAATALFAVQIYCDFSGYSDIAIGASQVMGVRLMENFRQPYYSQSVSEFWKRWHISLSTWFRDYLYIPLGGNRVPAWRMQANLLVVFLISGLWHGASWNYVIWGALHGAYLVAGMRTAAWRARAAAWTGLDRFPRLLAGLNVASTFALVCFAWIFFRAETFPKAWYIATHLLDGLPGDVAAVLSPSALAAFLSDLGVSKYALLAILVLEAGHLLQLRGGLGRWLAARPAAVRWGAYYALGAWILLCFNPGGKQFIYFQF